MRDLRICISSPRQWNLAIFNALEKQSIVDDCPALDVTIVGELNLGAAISGSKYMFVCGHQMVINFDTLSNTELNSCFFKTHVLNIRLSSRADQDCVDFNFS